MDVFNKFDSSLTDAAREIGFDKPNDLQTAIIPPILEEKDLVVYTNVEEGRSLAYLMPILEKVDPENAYVQALILTPSSESAQRIHQDLEQLSTRPEIQIAGIYGLQESITAEPWNKGVHIIIGTPSSVQIQITKRALDLYHIQFLVVEKIDELISCGMALDLEKLVVNVSDARQSIIFTESGSKLVHKTINKVSQDPVFLAFPVNFFATGKAHVEYLLAEKSEKEQFLFDFLESENPISALILFSSQSDVKEWINRFNRFGYRVSFIVREAGKERLLARAEKGQTRFMIATDIAAKHDKSLAFSHRVIMDLPNDQSQFEEMVKWSHEPAMPPRNIVILDPTKMPVLQRLAKESGVTLQEFYRPSEEFLAIKLAERIHSLLEQRYRSMPESMAQNHYRYFPVVEHLLQAEDGGRLLGLLAREFLQRAVHHPLTPDSRSSKSRHGSRGNRRYQSGAGQKPRRGRPPHKRSRRPGEPSKQQPDKKEEKPKPSILSRIFKKDK